MFDFVLGSSVIGRSNIHLMDDQVETTDDSKLCYPDPHFDIGIGFHNHRDMIITDAEHCLYLANRLCLDYPSEKFGDLTFHYMNSKVDRINNVSVEIQRFDPSNESDYWTMDLHKIIPGARKLLDNSQTCLLYTSPSPRD